jgi:carbon storage regulator
LRPAAAGTEGKRLLILSRRERESIVIPRHGIEIAVVAIRGDTVKVGIHAPDEIGVYRREVWLAIERQMERDKRKDGDE